MLTGFPMFFATKALKSRNLTIQAGEPFPFQDIATIRGYAAAFGVEHAETLPASQLPYVEVIDVGDLKMQRRIFQQGLTAKDVKRRLTQEAA